MPCSRPCAISSLRTRTISDEVDFARPRPWPARRARTRAIWRTWLGPAAAAAPRRCRCIDWKTPGKASAALSTRPRARCGMSSALEPAQQAFQLGTQLALLEMGDTLDRLIATAAFQGDPASSKLARVGLANYYLRGRAAAALRPVPGGGRAAALRHRPAGPALLAWALETVCHRLSTLQRPGAPGVPFFFVRVDRAGNISKRQSATHFHFSRTGGTCPLWTVYEAFGQPDQVLRQLASMPDGRRYLWIARSVSHGQRGYGSPRTRPSPSAWAATYAMPRCLVYAKGLDLGDPESATPIGMGCKRLRTRPVHAARLSLCGKGRLWMRTPAAPPMAWAADDSVARAVRGCAVGLRCSNGRAGRALHRGCAGHPVPGAPPPRARPVAAVA
ncbi:Tyrosine-protein kinase STYK1 [Manis javanica]|nr:Tyrosine-protein kinase STYK1 [Manis javanica]